MYRIRYRDRIVEDRCTIRTIAVETSITDGKSFSIWKEDTQDILHYVVMRAKMPEKLPYRINMLKGLRPLQCSLYPTLPSSGLLDTFMM